MLLRVRVPATEAELAADLLWQQGATAVEERADGSTVVLVADVAADAVGTRWPAAAFDPGDGWWDAWREFATAIRIGPRLVVRPPWVPTDPRPGDRVLEIDPGRAFGSGSHGSTRLALAALDDLAPITGTVLDVGCGSGVLSVMAAVVGAEAVTAVDVNDAAVEATRDNARRNGVGDRIDVSTTRVADLTATFELVVANLDLPVLLDLAGLLPDRVAPGGMLIASGMLADRVPDVVAALGWSGEVETTVEDVWAALVCRPRAGDAC